ncbi:hypothetical protein P692DRAFT_20879198 [Suillus brevipes Sb2]|nr:hypothetical protein P692DRAFT_20879198 [Suillus brevipes Sb2]
MTYYAVAAHPYASRLTTMDPAGHHELESASHTPEADDPGKKRKMTKRRKTLPTLVSTHEHTIKREICQTSSDRRRQVGSRVMDQTNLHRHARHNAQEAITLARQRALQFDAQAAFDSKMHEALKLAKAQAHIGDDDESGPSGASNTPLADRKFFLDAQAEVINGGVHAVDSDELNFQKPTPLIGELKIEQSKMPMAQLKEFQLKGLNWLATLYEQGINGILADEMGLGKTVQSISLLAYLAEVHDLWGAFLVAAPASTLHNWQQEITHFVPGLKALPYLGNVKDRRTEMCYAFAPFNYGFIVPTLAPVLSKWTSQQPPSTLQSFSNVVRAVA